MLTDFLFCFCFSLSLSLSLSLYVFVFCQVSKYQQPEVDLDAGLTKALLIEIEQVSWVRQLRILMERNWQETMRKRHMLFSSFVQVRTRSLLLSHRPPSRFLLGAHIGIIRRGGGVSSAF